MWAHPLPVEDDTYRRPERADQIEQVRGLDSEVLRALLGSDLIFQQPPVLATFGSLSP